MKKTAPISLAGSQLGEVRHVCVFFNNADEEYRIFVLHSPKSREFSARRWHPQSSGARRSGSRAA